jgi:hypothetical protein
MKCKKTFEVIALGGALVVSLGGDVLPANVHAATGTACSLTTNGAGVSIAADVQSSFVKVAFTPKCSPNTVVTFNDAGTSFSAKGGSKKGNIFYGATSEGGGGATQCGSTTVADPSVSAATAPANGTNGCS